MRTREKLVEYRRLLALLPDNLRYDFQNAVTEKKLEETLKTATEWASEVKDTVDKLRALMLE